MESHNLEKLLESEEFKIWKLAFMQGVERFRLREVILDFMLNEEGFASRSTDFIEVQGIQRIEQKGMLALWNYLVSLGEVEGGESIGTDYVYDGE